LGINEKEISLSLNNLFNDKEFSVKYEFILIIDSISLFIKNNEIEVLSTIKDKINIINKINPENKVSLIDKLNISLEAKDVT